MSGMTRGPFRPISAGFAAATFVLLVAYIFLTAENVAVVVTLVVVFGLLALRASGLKKADIEATPQDGHLKFKTEFEGPDDDGEEGET